ncbi:MAG TPA: hypothetical protein PL089_13880 [Ignavibacteria bacterium]|nr:hypothetical protein [Ignavibacteriaceae bacterium]HRK00695.1 hypothetical protein [Ignavibacteria bacterium]
MSKQEFLNFAEISKKIKFGDVLDWLNVAYQKKQNELRGDGFIVSIDKNLYFSPQDDLKKGSVINFVSSFKDIGLREAALLLKHEFLSKKKEVQPKRDLPDLHLEYHEYLAELLIPPEISKDYEVGYVRQRSIIAGRIAFKMYDNEGAHIGYVGYKKEDDSWFFPKGFKRPLYNLHRIIDKKAVIVTADPFDALRIISLKIKNVVSLVSNSMTAEQEQVLKQFKYILIFNKAPENIVNRLCSSTFVKAPLLYKPIKELSDQELKTLIKPS